AISTLNSAACEEYSNIIEIIVTPPLVGGTINPSSESICSGDTPSTLSVTGGSTGFAITYQWQNSTDGVVYSDILGATAQTFAPPVLNQTTYYKRLVYSLGGGPPASCNEESSVSIINIIDLDPGAIDPSIELDYCYGATPPTLTSSLTAGVPEDGSNSVGVISYQWQMSTNNTMWSDIASATQNYYNPPSLIETTWYRRVAISTDGANSCDSPTASVRIGILPELNAGAVLSDQDICTIITPADLPNPIVIDSAESLSASVSYQWQISSDRANWTDILNQQAGTLNFTVGGDGVVGTADDDSWLPTAPASYYRAIITYVGDPQPVDREQTKILLSNRLVAMTADDYSIAINGNQYTVTTTAASTIDSVGTSLANVISNNDSLVNATYNEDSNIITITPLTAGNYNVASTTAGTGPTIAVLEPLADSTINMKILVSGNNGTRSPNPNVASCQAYSNVVEITVSVPPILTQTDGPAQRQDLCENDAITPITFKFGGSTTSIEIRNLDAGLTPFVNGPGTVTAIAGPPSGWWSISGATSSTFTISGNIQDSSVFTIVTILDPASNCSEVQETYSIIVTPNAVQPNFIRMDVNQPGYEVLSSAMSSDPAITALTPTRWYNNTVCQDRLPAPTTSSTNFFTCYIDNAFNQQTNVYEWEVSPPGAGNMVDNNYQQITIGVNEISALVNGETYTVTITTASGTITAYQTTSSTATQTADLIGLDLANKIAADAEVTAIYNNVNNQIIIEALATNTAFTASAAPLTTGQSIQLGTPFISQNTRSGTMDWDPAFFGRATISVRALGCGNNYSNWTSVEIDVIPQNVPANAIVDLNPPIALDVDVCSGGTTGPIPDCQIDVFTLPTQFFSDSDNPLAINDYASLEWRIINEAPGTGATVAVPGTIAQATGIITWNIGWFGAFDLQVRPTSCDGVIGNWVSTTINIGPINDTPAIILRTALPECPIPASGFQTTLFSDQVVNWYVNSSVGLTNTTSFVNTNTLQLTPEANNDLILDFEPGYWGNVIITAEPASCPGTSVTYIIQVPEPPELTLTSAINSNFQVGSTSVCLETAITTITYDVSGAADAVSVTGLPVGVIGSLEIMPQSTVLSFSDSGTPFTANQIYSININNATYSFTTNGATNTFDFVGTGLQNVINSGTSDFVASYVSPNLSIDVSGSGRRGDSYIIASSTPVGNSVSIAAPLVTVLQKILTISGSPIASVTPGVFNYTVTTRAPAADCAVASATGSIEVEAPATISITNGTADNNGTPICNGTSFGSGSASLITFQLQNATLLTVNPLTPLPNGLALALSASGTFNEYEIIGLVNEPVVVPTTFTVNLNSSGAICADASIQVIIQVDPSPVIVPRDINLVNQTECSGSAIDPIIFEVFNSQAFSTALVSSTLPNGVTGQLYQQAQLSQFQVDFSVTAADVTFVNETFTFNINNTVYTYVTQAPLASLTNNQLAAELNTFLTAQLPAADFSVIYTTGSNIIQIQAVNPGIAFDIISSDNSTFLDISSTTVVNPPAYFEISGTPSVTLTIPTDYDYTIQTTGISCSGSSVVTGTITVNPNSAVYVSGDINPSICDNETITDIVYLANGATAVAVVTPTTPSWVIASFNALTNEVTISTPNPPTQNVTVTTVYTYQFNLIGSAFGCTTSPVAIQGTITISPIDGIAHIITSGLETQDICVADNPFTITPIEYQLSGGATGATVTGLPPGITAFVNTISNTLLISGTATAIPSPTFTYNYQVVTTPANCSSASAVGAITVFSQPELTLVSTPTSDNQVGIYSVCDQTPIETIIYEFSPVPNTQAVFTWTGSNSFNYFGSGISAQDSGTTQFVIQGTPTTGVTQTTIYTYQIQTVGSLCSPQVLLTGSIEINPIDSIVHIPSSGAENQSVCVSDQNNPSTALADNYVAIEYQLVGGATGVDVVGLPLGLGYSITSSNTVLISGAVNANATPTLYNYIITTNGSCTNATANGSIDVLALPTLTLLSSATSVDQTRTDAICDATPIETIIYEMGGGATRLDFSWIGSNTLDFSGLTRTVSGTQYIISGTPTTGVTETTTYSYEITTGDSGCAPEIVLSGSIEIKPNQIITLISSPTTNDQIICVNDAVNSGSLFTSNFTSIEYQLGGAATGASVIGLPDGIGYSITPSNTILISGTAAPSATSLASPTIIYTYTINTSGDCDATQVQGTIEVHSLPVLSLTSTSSTANQVGMINSVCINTPIDEINYRFEGGATGVQFSWTSPGPLTGVTATNSGTNGFRIFGSPSVNIAVPTVYEYQIVTTGSECSPEITLTGSIEVKPADLLVLTSAAGTDNQDICVGGLPASNSLTDIVYELRNGAQSASVTGLPPGVGFSINASGTLTISGTAQASASLSSSTISPFIYTITTIGCSPFVMNGTINVIPKPEITLVAGTEYQEPVCNNTPIIPVNYVFNPAAGSVPTVTWPDGQPSGISGSFSTFGGSLSPNMISIQGTPNVAILSTTVYRYVITYSGTCDPDVVVSGSFGVIPTPVIDSTYIIANDVTNVSCFEGTDGSIIIPDDTVAQFEDRISGGLLSQRQIDEITLTGTTAIGDIIEISFGGKTYSYTVRADIYLNPAPEDFQTISNELTDIINNAVSPNESSAAAVPFGSPTQGRIRLTADVGGIALNTSVNVVQTANISNTITTTQINRALNYSYSWTGPNSFTSSNLSISNLSAGDYFLTVDLNGCAETSAAITVAEPPELIIDINACGGATGSFEASITGGTPPYTLILEDDNGIQIGPPVVSNGGQIYTGLAVGDDYVLEVTDATCNLAVREAIEIPTQLFFSHWDLNDGVTDSYCTTSGNGSIELTRSIGGAFESAFSGGSNVFSYVWTSSSSSATIGVTPNVYDLQPDIYTVTVTDLVLGCSEIKSFTVGGYPELELEGLLIGGLQVNITGVSSSTADYVYYLTCNDDNDAAFTLNATGGNNNYTITSTVPVGSSVSNIGGSIVIQDGLPGLYTFTVQDVGPNGLVCDNTKTVQVFNPEALYVVEMVDLRIDPICSGEFGYLEFNVLGGDANRGPYTITLNGGQLVGSSLSAGDRRVIFSDIDTSMVSEIEPLVEIEDAFGCSTTASLASSITFNITQSFEFEAQVTDIDCSIPSPGSVVFNEIGPDTFTSSENIQIRVYRSSILINIYKAWGTDPNTSVEFQLDQPGLYSYDITDSNSCVLISGGEFEIVVVGNPNPLDIASIDVTQVGCENDVSIIALDVVNIQPPLTINWFQYKSTTISTPTGTGTSTTSTNVTVIAWLPISSLDGNATVSNLDEGIYRAEVSDGRSENCGGTLVTNSIILQESSIQITNFRTIENNPALCDNYGTSFTSDVLFSISENLSRNLGSNSFNITLLSESGTVISNPAAWDLDSNGILDPKPQGYVYRYPSLQADRYTLIVEESIPASSTLTACSEVFFFEIQDYLPISYAGQTIFETDICTGRVDLIEGLASGGVPFIINGLPTYQFEWTYTPDDPTERPAKFFGETIQNALPGSYCVKITDSNGCFYDSCDTSSGGQPLEILVEDVVLPFTISPNLTDRDDPTLLVKSLSPDCESGGQDGRIGVELSGGLLPYEITWFIEDPTAVVSGTSGSSVYIPVPDSTNRTSLDGLVPGNYRMVITSINPRGAACAAVGDFLQNDYLYYEEIIQVSPNRELYIIEGPFVDEDLCSGLQGRIIVDVFDNNNGNLSFYYNDILIPSADVVRINDRSWSVAIVNAIDSADFKIVNEEGCWISSEISRGIGVPNFEYTSPNFEISSSILAREEVTFLNTSTDPFVTSEWIFGDNSAPVIAQSSTSSVTPIRHAYGVSGTYFATLRIYNSIGCSEEETQPIVVGRGYNIMVPNVFTPNNDLINDNFRPLFSGFNNMTFTVYDYRGNVIYNEFVEELDLTNLQGISVTGWDGTLAPYSPYYIFTASGILLDGETVVEKSGTFILIN
ncbi:MAG: gliding motility-associated C-terminal domain-containing protein, partial [Flavobacteriaceae bacterium]|nr:gliding motility-associated C-terminal domain-containing protein [Flavobacteriaceae bacterium]